jgi:hypothetical protein
LVEGRVHFLVGVSRCGITPLSRCLNLHPDVAVYGQSRFFGRCWVEPECEEGYTRAQLDEILRVLLQFRWTATLGDSFGSLRSLTLADFRNLLRTTFAEVNPPVRPGALFTVISERIADAEGKRYVFEKTPHHLNWIDRIVEEVPGAGFVVLLADPYTFARFHRAEDPLYHPVASAVLWRAYMRSFERALSAHADRMIVLGFDELVSDGRSALERVQCFFGVDLHELPARFLEDRLELECGPDEVDIFWVNLLCRREMRRHGYARQPTPFVFSSVIRSFFTLLRWTAESLPRARGRGFGSRRYLLSWLRP